MMRFQMSAVLGLILALTTQGLGDDTKDKKDDKKSGTVVGIVAAKGDNWVEVKASGEEKARRYVPHWVGGAPAQGGGLDKKMVGIIKGLKIGSRVRLNWEFEERARVVKVEVLEAPAGKEKEEPEKKGTVVGKLTLKDAHGIEVKADGEEKARRYTYHNGGTPELRKAIEATELGSRVRVEWTFNERARVMKFEVLRGEKE